MANASENYLLAGGTAELERLQLQARVWEPEAEVMLDHIGLRPDGDACDGHLLARWRDAKKVPAMGRAHDSTRHDLLTFGNQVLNGELPIRESAPHNGSA